MSHQAKLATKRDWIGLAVLALPCILATMDLTVLNLAVPHLSEQLKPSSSQLLWIMDIYGFMIAGALITMGTLGDRIGRRKLLLIGAAAFGLSSILAAFSKSTSALIAARAVLGVAGATLAPSTLSLIRNMFHDARQRTIAISIWVTCFSVGAAIGPLLGGILLEHFWWGSVFLLNVPIMILLLVLGPILLPEFHDPNAERPDLPSAALSLAAVLLIIFGLKRSAEYGFGPLPLGCMGAGFAIAAIFVRRQTSLNDPLIDLNLFRSSAFTAALSMNMLGCFVAFGAFWFIGQYLQLVLGLSPLHAGLVSLPSSVAFIIGTQLTPPLARRVRPGFIIGVGLIITAAGFALLATLPIDHGIPMMMIGSFVYSLGIAPIFTLSTDLVVGSAPPNRAGAAASISETSTEFGGAVGMAVLGSLGMAFYRGQLTRALPTGISFEAAEAARGTLGGALAVAAKLPAESAQTMLFSAREAFMQALHGTMIVCSVISILMAVLAASVLGRLRIPKNNV